MLDSIFSQKTNYDIQFICIVDNSTQETYDYLEKRLKESGINYKIKAVQLGSTGLSRNAGIDLADGEYIMFIDDDDWFIGDDAIQKALDFAYEHSKWDICRFGFHWNMNYIRGCFVWQYIFKRKVFDKYRFQGKVAQEDVLIMRQIYGDLGTHEYNRNVFPTLNEELYYYNYPREGSILDRLHKGEIERPE